MVKTILKKTIFFFLLAIVLISSVVGDAAKCEPVCKMACMNVYDENKHVFGTLISSVRIVANLYSLSYDNIDGYYVIEEELNGEGGKPKKIDHYHCEGGTGDYCEGTGDTGYVYVNQNGKYKQIDLRLFLIKEGSKITATANLNQGQPACQDLKVKFSYKVYNDWNDDGESPQDWCTAKCETIGQQLPTSLLDDTDLKAEVNG